MFGAMWCGARRVLRTARISVWTVATAVVEICSRTDAGGTDEAFCDALLCSFTELLQVPAAHTAVQCVAPLMAFITQEQCASASMQSRHEAAFRLQKVSAGTLEHAFLMLLPCITCTYRVSAPVWRSNSIG